MNANVNASAAANDAGQVRLAKIRVDELIVKSGALQQAILNSSNFSVIATDEMGIVQLFNAGAELMLGFAASDVVDKITPADISDPFELSLRATALSKENSIKIAPGFEALVFKAARGIEDIYELTYIRKDKSRLPAIVSVTALRTDGGPIIGYLLIATDNTVRKDAEDKRLWAEESFQLMVESVTDCAIIMLDQEGRVESWNEGAQRIQGYKAKEIIGQHNSRFFTQEDIAINKPERALQEAAAADRSEDNGWRVRKDGSTFWANVVMTAIRDNARLAPRLRDARTRHDGAPARRVRTQQGQGDGRSGQSREIGIPVQHESRAAHAAERHSRLCTVDGIRRAAAVALAEGQHRPDSPGGMVPARVDQRSPRPVADRSGRLSLSQEKMSLAEVLSDCQSMMEPLALKRGIKMTFPRSMRPVTSWPTGRACARFSSISCPTPSNTIDRTGRSSSKSRRGRSAMFA